MPNTSLAICGGLPVKFCPGRIDSELLQEQPQPGTDLPPPNRIGEKLASVIFLQPRLMAAARGVARDELIR